MPDALRALIRAELPDLVAIRHDLHEHPELMFAEQRTAGVVERELRALGIETRTGMARGTGVLGHLPATNTDGRPAVALRADMDALPIVERTGKAYASKTDGVMHACGHDGHTTVLIGAARVLSRLDDRPNPVTFVFQPAEEGGAGGEKMCDDGALRGAEGGGLGTPVSRIFALHGWPNVPLGHVQARPGPMLAATDDFVVRVRGKGGHAAYPHAARDPIVAAAHTVTALQSIASRDTSPLDSIVCTVGQIHGGTAANVIPDTTELNGTIRTLLPETRRLARERFFTICESVATAHGCHAEIEWHEGYPVTRNDEELVERFLAVARDALGPERVEVLDAPSMGGEDFSFYGLHVPACFFFLGMLPDGADPNSSPRLHQPEYDFNDDGIETGVEMMCRLALDA